MQTQTPTLPHPYCHMRTHKHTNTQPHTLTLSHITHSRTHSRTYGTHTITHSHTHVHALKHLRTRAITCSQTHTLTRLHSHTHVQSRWINPRNLSRQWHRWETTIHHTSILNITLLVFCVTNITINEMGNRHREQKLLRDTWKSMWKRLNWKTAAIHHHKRNGKLSPWTKTVERHMEIHVKTTQLKNRGDECCGLNFCRGNGSARWYILRNVAELHMEFYKKLQTPMKDLLA